MRSVIGEPATEFIALRCGQRYRCAVRGGAIPKSLGIGYVERDITQNLRGLLEPPKMRHRPGITDPRRLGELLHAIDGYAGREVIGIALKLALLFFVRPGELRKARWEQFDFERVQWRIPATCMKARVQHLVPLSHQTLELLRRLHLLTGNSEYLFPLICDSGRPLHGAALSCALASAVAFARDLVLVQVAVGPAHRRLQDGVQLGQSDRLRDYHPPPDVRLDALQFDAQLDVDGDRAWGATRGSTSGKAATGGRSRHY